MLAENSAVIEQTKTLCETITKDEDFAGLMKQVEAFLGHDEARLLYQSVHEAGSELQQKQHAGIELSDGEIKRFEEQREALFNHPVASSFMDAKGQLEAVQKTVSQYVGMTLELGRVPTPEDFAAQESGCCGGGGGGG